MFAEIFLVTQRHQRTFSIGREITFVGLPNWLKLHNQLPWLISECYKLLRMKGGTTRRKQWLRLMRLV